MRPIPMGRLPTRADACRIDRIGRFLPDGDPRKTCPKPRKPRTCRRPLRLPLAVIRRTVVPSFVRTVARDADARRL